MNISAKTAYSKAARKKLLESRAKLDGVTAAINHAITTGRLRPSVQLDGDLHAMEVNFTAAETQLRILQKSGEEEWEEQCIELESAWENLARSIKSLVSRFADGTRQERDRNV